jgi:hypothetical protein
MKTPYTEEELKAIENRNEIAKLQIADELAKVNKNASTLPTKGKEDITKKLLGAYNKNLIIAVVLVAGYFAYKKFKK